MEDYVPGIVAFNVDYFSTLFVSVCMSSSGSVTVSVLAIFTDVLLSALEFREVRKNADILYKSLQNHKNWSYNHLSHQGSENLLSLTLEVARNPEARNLPGVRLWACNPHPLPSERFEALKRPETLDVYSTSSYQSVKANISPTSRSSTNAILSSEVADEADQSKKLIIQGVQLLFHCEYIVLVEYIECVIPIVFVIYKSVLQQLPNVAYAPGGADGWRNSAVGNIMIFAVLEVFSFIALKILLQRKFAFSPLYQLAYVLETQVELVQIDVFIATLVLLPSELEHFGMDFSLRFDWL
ncbi:hypothetical protein PHYSODRAFT_520068 [Phytophthora sojae]|uniref:Uncharacterized protein n=1 Tax=Phytophthora sojae (strain P6497) TaxID=1094619 RepID=G5A069_PHYSP|nr:hypothetical protein PHYSODRAFT_520068 [Phytophthora sojae]EGZ11312.1 hypothetical protein PHYSODRAFT_520068 [Phytophthora sojae]|eukprot:XP_009534057.1 hypothetical protein PHYSODRAFT_520068 [Phytophthora sojae]